MNGKTLIGRLLRGRRRRRRRRSARKKIENKIMRYVREREIASSSVAADRWKGRITYVR
jgi:hypothetical protein